MCCIKIFLLGLSWILAFDLSTSMETGRITTNSPAEPKPTKIQDFKHIFNSQNFWNIARTNLEVVPVDFVHITPKSKDFKFSNNRRTPRSVSSMDDSVNSRPKFVLYNGVMLPLKPKSNQPNPEVENSDEYFDKQITEDEIDPLKNKKKLLDKLHILLNKVHKLRKIATNVELQLSIMTLSNLKRKKQIQKIVEKNRQVYWFPNQLKSAAEKEYKKQNFPFSDLKLKVSTTVKNSNSSDLRLTYSDAPSESQDLTIEDYDIGSEGKDHSKLLLDQLKGSKYYDMSVSDSIYNDIMGLTELVTSADKLEDQDADLPEPEQTDVESPVVNLVKRSVRSKRSLLHQNPIFQKLFSHSDLSKPFTARFLEASKPDRLTYLKVHHNQEDHIHLFKTTTNNSLPPSLKSSCCKNSNVKLQLPKLPNVAKKYNFTLTPSLNKTLQSIWSLPSKNNPVVFQNKHAVPEQSVIKNNITSVQATNGAVKLLEPTVKHSNVSYSFTLPLQKSINYTNQFINGEKVTTAKPSFLHQNQTFNGAYLKENNTVLKYETLEVNVTNLYNKFQPNSTEERIVSTAVSNSSKPNHGTWFVRLPPNKVKNVTFNSSDFRSKQTRHHNLVVYHLKNQQGTTRPRNSTFNHRSDMPVENNDEHLLGLTESTNKWKKEDTRRKVLAKIIKRPVSKTNTKNLVASLLKSESLRSVLV